MISAFNNPNQPPLMSPESQKPGLFALGKANFMESMKDPRKAAILQSMLMQSLQRFGPGMMGGRQRMHESQMINPMDFATLMQRPQAPSPMPQAQPSNVSSGAGFDPFRFAGVQNPTTTPPVAAQSIQQTTKRAMPPKDLAQSPLAKFRSGGPRYYQAI